MPQDQGNTLPPFASLRLCAFALNSLLWILGRSRGRIVISRPRAFAVSANQESSPNAFQGDGPGDVQTFQRGIESGRISETRPIDVSLSAY